MNKSSSSSCSIVSSPSQSSQYKQDNLGKIRFVQDDLVNVDLINLGNPFSELFGHNQLYVRSILVV